MIRPSLRLALLLLLATSCSTLPARGHSTPPTPEPHRVQVSGGETAAPERSEEPAEEFEKNALNLFLGGSGAAFDRLGFTIGADYERRLSQRWGLGGFVEDITGEARSFAVGMAAYYHPTEALILVAGPGAEQAQGEWGALLRMGAAYEFELGGGFILSPGVYYDLTESEHIWIYGLNFGKKF